MLPDDYFSPGEAFKADAIMNNDDEPVNLPLFALLEIAGQYWFWDNWSRRC